MGFDNYIVIPSINLQNETNETIFLPSYFFVFT